MNHFTRLKTLIFMGLTQNTIILAAPAIPEEMLKMPITTIISIDSSIREWNGLRAIGL